MDIVYTGCGSTGFVTRICFVVKTVLPIRAGPGGKNNQSIILSNTCIDHLPRNGQHSCLISSTRDSCFQDWHDEEWLQTLLVPWDDGLITSNTNGQLVRTNTSGCTGGNRLGTNDQALTNIEPEDRAGHPSSNNLDIEHWVSHYSWDCTPSYIGKTSPHLDCPTPPTLLQSRGSMRQPLYKQRQQMGLRGLPHGKAQVPS